MKTRILSVLMLGGLGLSPALSEPASTPERAAPQAWIREVGIETPLFDYYETRSTGLQEGVERVVRRSRFVERETGEDAFREVITTDSGGLTLYSYEVEQLQIDEKGSILVDHPSKKIAYRYYKNGEWKENTAKLELPFLVGAMIPSFIQAHGEALLQSKRVKFNLAVPYMLKSFNFTLHQHDKVDFEGLPMSSIKMGASHLFVSAVVEPLYFMFDPASKDVRQILGKVFLKKRVKDGWDGFKAETYFLKTERK